MNYKQYPPAIEKEKKIKKKRGTKRKKSKDKRWSEQPLPAKFVSGGRCG
jgi:hypothetical protein